jgi:hypothetical protein
MTKQWIGLKQSHKLEMIRHRKHQVLVLRIDSRIDPSDKVPEDDLFMNKYKYSDLLEIGVPEVLTPV